MGFYCRTEELALKIKKKSTHLRFSHDRENWVGKEFFFNKSNKCANTHCNHIRTIRTGVCTNDFTVQWQLLLRHVYKKNASICAISVRFHPSFVFKYQILDFFFSICKQEYNLISFLAPWRHVCIDWSATLWPSGERKGYHSNTYVISYTPSLSSTSPSFVTLCHHGSCFKNKPVAPSENRISHFPRLSSAHMSSSLLTMI